MKHFLIIDGTLHGYSGLAVHLTLPDGVTGIRLGAFRSSQTLEEIDLPASCTRFNGQVFAWCRRLRAVHAAPSSPFLREIDGVLYSHDLSALVYWPCAKPFTGLPPTVRDIRRGAMYGHSAATIDLPEGVEMIQTAAFASCRSLASVTLPSSLRMILTNAFAGCESLETVVLPDGLQSIGTGAFSGCPLRTLHLPASLTMFHPGVFGETDSIEQITVDPANEHFTAIDGVLYDKAVTTLLFCPGTVRKLVLPPTVTCIPAFALQCCGRLTSLTLPDGLETIGDFAFERCTSLRTLTLPDSFRGEGWEMQLPTEALSRTIRFCGVDILERDILYEMWDGPLDETVPLFARIHAFLHGSTDVWLTDGLRLWLAWAVYRRGDRSPAIAAMIAPQRETLHRRLLARRDEAALAEAVAAFPPDDDVLDALIATAEADGARACWIVLLNEKQRRGGLGDGRRL